MKTKLFSALALVAAMGLPLPANASLQTLSDLFVFGDSLSDGGNSGLVSEAYAGVTYPPYPYFNGQYSNGQVAVEYLWRSYNGSATFTPSLAGGKLCDRWRNDRVGELQLCQSLCHSANDSTT